MIDRPQLLNSIDTALRRNPITALLGPRQCGKTTLARRVASERPASSYFDLEDPVALQSLANPATILGNLTGLIVIDEVQRSPDLFPVLRVLADQPSAQRKFLLLGSASPDLLRQTSESLAGRVEFVEMGGFDLRETGVEAWRSLWWRGGFPRSFLAEGDGDSEAWREMFVRTFLERDLPQLGITIPALTLRRFWTMVAHYHGQTWNSSEVAASLGVSDVTARRYLDILAGAYMVRLLPPWHENIAKRQRRAPKLYMRDSGLLHTLLGISAPDLLWSHPKCGASWEGFALEQVLGLLPSRDVYYWAVHSGPELDLLVFRKGKRLGIEFKFSDAPAMTRSLRAARQDLKLDALWVVYPGDRSYPLDESAQVVPLSLFSELAAQL